jgi:hypothetical protein
MLEIAADIGDWHSTPKCGRPAEKLLLRHRLATAAVLKRHWLVER